jgi:glycosidase
LTFPHRLRSVSAVSHISWLHSRYAKESTLGAAKGQSLVQRRRHLPAPRPQLLRQQADGVGDFPGLTQKLDYLQELGITAIWLLPFYPSPLRDDGYDIADYTSVNPAYGSLEDFKAFLDPAHTRGIRVIIELVLNHTSDQHPWFQEARSSRDNPRRDW